MRIRLVAVIALLLLSAPTVHAQVARGDVGLGFSTALSWSRYERDIDDYSRRTTSIGGAVSSTYFVNRRVDVGGFASINYSDSSEGYDGFSTSIGPTVGVHFRPAKPIVPLVGASFGYFYGQQDIPANPISDKTTLDSHGWSFSVFGGADFFVRESVSVRFTLGYHHDRTDREYQRYDPVNREYSIETAPDEADNVGISAGLAFFLKKNR